MISGDGKGKTKASLSFLPLSLYPDHPVNPVQNHYSVNAYCTAGTRSTRSHPTPRGSNHHERSRPVIPNGQDGFLGRVAGRCVGRPRVLELQSAPGATGGDGIDAGSQLWLRSSFRPTSKSSYSCSTPRVLSTCWSAVTRWHTRIPGNSVNIGSCPPNSQVRRVFV